MLCNIKPLYLRTKEETSLAQLQKKKHHLLLHQLSKSISGCADCTSSDKGWISFPHCIFICTECARIHRKLGPPISRVKSYTSGNYLWYEDEIEALTRLGIVSSLYRSKDGAPPRISVDALEIHKYNQAFDLYHRKKWFFLKREAAILPCTFSSKDEDANGFFKSFGL